MTDSDRVTRFFKNTGRTVERAKRAYGSAKVGTAADLPTDEEGRARIVCRRFAEKRSVHLDPEGHPACFEAEHPDCEGCFEDIRAEQIETWE